MIQKEIEKKAKDEAKERAKNEKAIAAVKSQEQSVKKAEGKLKALTDFLIYSN